MNNVRLGLIGCGLIAETQHLPALASLSGVHVVAAADADAERLERVCNCFQIPAREHEFEFLSLRSLIIIDASEDAHRMFVPEAESWRAYDCAAAGHPRQNGFICQQPFWFPTVLADGTVVGCEHDWNAQPPFGVVSESTTFVQVFNGERAAQARKIIRDSPASSSFSRNCPYAGLATSACSVQAAALDPLTSFRTVLSPRTG